MDNLYELDLTTVAKDYFLSIDDGDGESPAICLTHKPCNMNYYFLGDEPLSMEEIVFRIAQHDYLHLLTKTALNN